MSSHGWARAPHVIAHRGASHEAPENTLAALARAVALGCPAVEFDVQLTADGVPVLLHDDTLDRTTDGEGPLSEWTSAKLAPLDAGSWFAPEFSGQRVPTLEAALDLLAGRALLDVELKTPEPAPGLVLAVVEALDRRGLAEDAVLSSFLEATVREAAQRGMGAALIVPGEPTAEELARWADFSDAFGIWEGSLTAEVARACTSIGRPAFAWTVDEPARAAALLRAGASGVITNEPARLLAALAQ